MEGHSEMVSEMYAILGFINRGIEDIFTETVETVQTTEKTTNKNMCPILADRLWPGCQRRCKEIYLNSFRSFLLGTKKVKR